ncbi:MAG: hypothetical protein K6G63_09980 [Eubacterium sp.]|nr:hypothetical protein [Eubacterium sp.]
MTDIERKIEINNIHSDFRKIAEQIEFPKKPMLGSVVSWIFIVVLAAMGGIALRIATTSYNALLAWYVVAGVCLSGALALLLVIIKNYFTMIKEYKLAKNDFYTYQSFKALQFIASDNKKREENELFVEWRKEHPDKSLPEWVKEGLRYGSSLSAQEYLKLVEEYKNK